MARAMGYMHAAYVELCADGVCDWSDIREDRDEAVILGPEQVPIAPFPLAPVQAPRSDGNTPRACLLRFCAGRPRRALRCYAYRAPCHRHRGRGHGSQRPPEL